MPMSIFALAEANAESISCATKKLQPRVPNVNGETMARNCVSFSNCQDCCYSVYVEHRERQQWRVMGDMRVDLLGTDGDFVE